MQLNEPVFCFWDRIHRCCSTFQNSLIGFTKLKSFLIKTWHSRLPREVTRPSKLNRSSRLEVKMSSISEK